MSTNSYIGVKCEDGIRAIYCHWDGYPAHNGRILTESYTDFMKACELINNGDLSLLQPEIGTAHSFSNPVEGRCIYYGRDRGEKNVGYDKFYTTEEFMRKASFRGAEYAYLFQDGNWSTFKL